MYHLLICEDCLKQKQKNRFYWAFGPINGKIQKSESSYMGPLARTLTGIKTLKSPLEHRACGTEKLLYFSAWNLCLCVAKMWASAEGGSPEVTLETSMGSFTVEVISYCKVKRLPAFSVWFLRNPKKILLCVSNY